MSVDNIRNFTGVDLHIPTIKDYLSDKCVNFPAACALLGNEYSRLRIDIHPIGKRSTIIKLQRIKQLYMSEVCETKVHEFELTHELPGNDTTCSLINYLIFCIKTSDSDKGYINITNGSLGLHHKNIVLLKDDKVHCNKYPAFITNIQYTSFSAAFVKNGKLHIPELYEGWSFSSYTFNKPDELKKFFKIRNENKIKSVFNRNIKNQIKDDSWASNHTLMKNGELCIDKQIFFSSVDLSMKNIVAYEGKQIFVDLYETLSFPLTPSDHMTLQLGVF